MRAQAAQLACTGCFRTSDTTLSRCAKCRRVAYCGRDCQTKHWKVPKDECKRFQKVNAHDEKTGHTLPNPTNRFARYVDEQKIRGEVHLAGAAATYSSIPDAITYGIKCQVCFRTPFHDTDHKFSPCKKCQLAWWCSPECGQVFSEAAHTARHCTDLCTVSTAEQMKAVYEPRHKRLILLPTKNTQSAYIAPSSLTSWDHYYQTVFPEFAADARSFARPFESDHRDVALAVQLLATDSTSMVLTLLHALEQSIPDLPTRSKLCIHIVAAANKEEGVEGMMEELLHYLPALQSVVVVYIGPTLRPAVKGRNLACSGCIQSRRRRVAIICPATYHAFAKTPEFRANPPDLVAGFHTGMGEVEVPGWQQSIPIVLDLKVPAVFTAYTRFEAMHDQYLLEDLGAFFVKTPERNPWRGIIPRVTEELESYSIDHYSNNYYFVVRGR
ncbi:hypothetical protein C8R46DRAFT_1058054 [Mycena filopes]|nr:hypothetical protein C8R46DRAFT_1058054 [Mycena filopes]